MINNFFLLLILASTTSMAAPTKLRKKRTRSCFYSSLARPPNSWVDFETGKPGTDNPSIEEQDRIVSLSEDSEDSQEKRINRFFENLSPPEHTPADKSTQTSLHDLIEKQELDEQSKEKKQEQQQEAQTTRHNCLNCLSLKIFSDFKISKNPKMCSIFWKQLVNGNEDLFEFMEYLGQYILKHKKDLNQPCIFDQEKYRESYKLAIKMLQPYKDWDEDHVLYRVESHKALSQQIQYLIICTRYILKSHEEQLSIKSSPIYSKFRNHADKKASRQCGILTFLFVDLFRGEETVEKERICRQALLIESTSKLLKTLEMPDL